ncbi:carboxylesterase/lipase family protein [Trinickia soli]|uniref:Carboxylic ester hydrolase n=1 Tax=Trinickia soli TaxID=380675 RepID=A0A2N7VLF9_9BURK|nr:carboxylesterase family protein [Trinickia soli]KAA0091781.1 carboxylesterase family protein [Paraburkholderia sp. T12-10]PMS17990.1 carboxylesterase [Trinickia soli]CAB3722648.1 Fumonisin B1 esterase [Trinickia soli]
MKTQSLTAQRIRFQRPTRSRTAAALLIAASLGLLSPTALNAAANRPATRINLPAGAIEGVHLSDAGVTLRAFKGIPYAAPPVGELRWKPPQPVTAWAGVRSAQQFGARCMQLLLFPMEFRTRAMSEDCLFLNVWTPAQAAGAKLPVLVYFYGGGFAAGDSSEPRYDGAALAARGMVTVTVNYRLGVFGFLALPEMARESPHGAAGNYGLLDQHAALRWVRENIARFGGDPDKITIGGESAGSVAVSTHMASPLSRGLFARAIGQSGAAFGPLSVWSREDAQTASEHFQQAMKAPSLSLLRAMPAETLLAGTGPKDNPKFLFWPSVDGHFLTQLPETTFAAGSQARVPLLVGSNSHEAPHTMVLNQQPPTPQNWRAALKRIFGPYSTDVLALYPGNDDDEVRRSATSLASDIFISHATRRWVDAHRETGGAPVYFYYYTHKRPPKRFPEPGQPPEDGAVHSAEIKYALGTLGLSNRFVWRPEDHAVSRIFSGYVAHFVKTGTPNDPSLPEWPASREERGGLLRQQIAVETKTITDAESPRHTFLRRYYDENPHLAHDRR